MVDLTKTPVTGIDCHAHVFSRELEWAAVRRYTPDYDATLGQYLDHLQTHGLSHGVLVQPSFLGTDNRFMVEALRQHSQRLRGVAVVDVAVSDAELDELAAAGVVGIRLNLIGKQLQDYTGPAWNALFERLAGRGWQVEIQRGIEDLAQIVPAIVATGVNVVIDHFGLPTGGIDAQNPGHQAFLQLLGDSRVWLKLSAAYRSNTDPVQCAAVVAQLRAAAGGSERLLWGSDWPNTQFEDRTDYAEQFELIEALLPDAAERHQVLVANPARLFGFPNNR